MEQGEPIYVYCDWESTGIWVGERGEINSSYERFGLPDELVVRFKYWERWCSDQVPGFSDERNRMDWDLFHSYGKALAVDLKRFLGEKHRVFFAYNTVDEKCIEIVLKRREQVEKEEGRIVPLSVPMKQL